MGDDRLGATYQNELVLHARVVFKETLERIIKAVGQDKFIFPEVAPPAPTPEMLMSEEPVERSMAIGAAYGSNGYSQTA